MAATTTLATAMPEIAASAAKITKLEPCFVVANTHPLGWWHNRHASNAREAVENFTRQCYNAGMNKPITVSDMRTRKLKLIKVGNSTGVILPRAVLERLRVSLGDALFLNESPQGYTLSAHDPDFAEAMGAAEDIMREDRDILAVLAR